MVIEKKIEGDGPVRMERVLDLWTDVEAGRGKKVIETLEEYTSLRPEVLAFAKLMEERLRKHDAGPRGQKRWPGVPVELLYEELAEKCSQLWSIQRGWIQPAAGRTKNEEMTRKAADVANFAMMIADVVGGLK
jgi:hypothetical protein